MPATTALDLCWIPLGAGPLRVGDGVAGRAVLDIAYRALRERIYSRGIKAQAESAERTR